MIHLKYTITTSSQFDKLATCISFEARQTLQLIQHYKMNNHLQFKIQLLVNEITNVLKAHQHLRLFVPI